MAKDATLKMQVVQHEWGQAQALINSAETVIEKNKDLEAHNLKQKHELNSLRLELSLRNRQHRVLSSVESAPDGTSGVAALLVEAMRQFPSTSQVQRETMAALSNIVSTECAPLLLRESVVPMTLGALESHFQDVPLVTNGCRLLWKLATKSTVEIMRRLLEGKTVVRLCLRLVVEYIKNQRLIFNACAVLRLMLGEEPTCVSPTVARFGAGAGAGAGRSGVWPDGGLRAGLGAGNGAASRGGGLAAVRAARSPFKSPPGKRLPPMSTPTRENSPMAPTANSKSTGSLPPLLPRTPDGRPEVDRDEGGGGGGGGGGNGGRGGRRAWGSSEESRADAGMDGDSGDGWEGDGEEGGTLNEVANPSEVIRLLLRIARTHGDCPVIVEYCFAGVGSLLFDVTFGARSRRDGGPRRADDYDEELALVGDLGEAFDETSVQERALVLRARVEAKRAKVVASLLPYFGGGGGGEGETLQDHLVNELVRFQDVAGPSLPVIFVSFLRRLLPCVPAEARSRCTRRLRARGVPDIIIKTASLHANDGHVLHQCNKALNYFGQSLPGMGGGGGGGVEMANSQSLPMISA